MKERGQHQHDKGPSHVVCPVWMLATGRKNWRKKEDEKIGGTKLWVMSITYSIVQIFCPPPVVTHHHSGQIKIFINFVSSVSSGTTGSSPTPFLLNLFFSSSWALGRDVIVSNKFIVPSPRCKYQCLNSRLSLLCCYIVQDRTALFVRNFLTKARCFFNGAKIFLV